MSVKESDLQKAITTLQNGGVVVFPTETAYGLAADATNKHAVNKIFSIKQRQLENKLPLIAASKQMVEEFTEVPDLLKELTDQFWPGPLTIAIKPKPGIFSENFINSEGLIAIRVSSNKIAQKLSDGLEKPIISTSANISGQPACYSVDSVKDQLSAQALQPDMYLDEGVLEKNKPSTIVKEENGKIVVVRQGELVVPNTYVA